MKTLRFYPAFLLTVGLLAVGLLTIPMGHAATLNLSDSPLFASQSAPPLTLMTMGRDHKLYYEAYNDASDLNGDGVLDVGYKPDTIDYYGYFGSKVCYIYNSGNSRFEPSSTTTTKKCSGANEWSGDFLNYLTTSRIDALRKVFYGGTRQTDTSSATVLERSYIPQDAHSWGKEYTDIATDGYDIREYSPLGLPTAGTRHLFANTTLLGGSGQPLFRVLNDSYYRIWEWVSIERPVAGSECDDGTRSTCTRSATGSTWEVVPASAFQDLTISTYNITSGTGSHPSDHTGYDTFVTNNAIAANQYGTGSVSNIDGSNAYDDLANPFGAIGPGGEQDNYLTIFSGKLNITTAQNYTFAVDGDDALELIIDGSLVTGWYGGHCDCNCNGQPDAGNSSCTSSSSYQGTVFLTAGLHDIEFRHEEAGGGDNYWLYWETSTSGAPASDITDYVVRTQVCVAGLLEDNCQAYPDGNYKPVGLLQNYGENDSMLFGLLTGSYEKNTSGGVLRKNIGSITDEINANDGTYTGTIGIIATMDRLKTVGFGSSYYYYDNCGWVTTRAINEGECNMWGSPVAEMMYEGMRYFAGKSGPTSAYAIASSGNDDATLGLPLPSWSDPYTSYSSCSKPFQIVIADINPSYDTDQLPGSYFGSFSGDISGLNVETLADTITSNESGIVGNHFIGQSGAAYDGAPTSKTVTSLGNIRGLAPEEPTKQGGYYSASIGYYGTINDISAATGDQKIDTFSVALASPLPRIEIPVAGTTITLVPFAKSVGGSSISAAVGDFQPTNTIVDFYVESLTPVSGKFTINYEDVEQGADHDMDAIVEYEYTVNPDNTVTIDLNSTYAAGGIIQHMGYIISGTTADGIYLEVRDRDTAAGSDPDYFLDTPNTAGVALPLTASRTFTPGTGIATATLLKDPLWYAAKWGGFQEDSATANDLPDLTSEWDEDGDGTPDNYFLVTNALNLSTQLSNAFNEIIARSGVSASAAALTSGEISSDTMLIQSTFNTGTWTGNVRAYSIISDPALGTVGSISSTAAWSAEDQLPAPGSRVILTHDGSNVAGAGVPFRWTSGISTAQKAILDMNSSGATDNRGDERVDFLRGTTGITGFRDRVDEDGNSHILGDMVNSSPAFVGNPDAFFPDNWGSGAAENSHPYSTFYNTYQTTPRTPMVYVGGNDGMLHGFEASASGSNMGKERAAYIPNEVFPRLSALTAPSYKHKFYVDGTPTVSDAFFSSAWHTVLVGGLNRGGQAIYALDVTDPSSNFSEASAGSTVLWEYADNNDTDTDADMQYALGYTYSKPTIVRLNNGKWGAVFGNGYNNTETDGTASTSGDAVLYILDIEDGSVIRKINTETGMAEDPTGAGRANGLNDVAPVDTDGDHIVDVVYAGDLFGNLWKFDLTDGSASNWEVAYKQGTTPKPLFVAQDSGGNVQPITVQPEVGYAPNGVDLMVYFGTGKYLEATDNTTTGSQTQTFYGIIDSGSRITGTPSTELLQQTVDAVVSTACTDIEGDSASCDLRVTSDNSLGSEKGWYINLPEEGERVIYRALLLGDTIVFVTLTPSGDECNPDGTGWLMELDAGDGSRLDESPFDLNGDGMFDESDDVSYDDDGDAATPDATHSGSGRRIEGGAPSGTPAILHDAQSNSDLKYQNTSSGTTQTIRENTFGQGTGRQSWRQIK